MVIPVDIDVNQLHQLGKDFQWVKPTSCPKCGGGLWWHGFVTAYLSCFAEAVFLRRIYCPYCFSSHRLRPKIFWSRFQSSFKTIENVISYRQKHGRWQPDLPRPRQRQWWHRMRKKVKVCLGMSFSGEPSEAFALFLEASSIPVSSVMQCGNSTFNQQPTEVYP